jgi:hypothetical protein
MTTEIIEKIRVGYPLSEQELNDAIEFYDKMRSGLRLLGTHYYLAWAEITRVYETLIGYRNYRQRDKLDKWIIDGYSD